MKKRIITLAIFFMSWVFASAQLTTRASMDYFPTGLRELISTTGSYNGITYGEQILASYGHFRVRVCASYMLKKIEAYFDQNVYMDSVRSYTFKPNNAEWSVGLKWKSWTAYF